MPSLPLSVSVVIPNYNGRELLALHLPAVIQACPLAEIIVVDDASSDESVAFIRSNFPAIKLIPRQTNGRFAVVCNQGVEAASGEIIILLNTDVEPTPNFLSPLLEPFKDQKVFAVGCAEKMTLTSSLISGRSGGAFRRGLMVHWREPDQIKTDTLWVSGGSGAFRKTMWQVLKGFDPIFSPAYEEDRDLCYRALKKGWKVCFAPQSLVIHHHEKTNQQALGTKQMQIASLKNHLLIVWKNITSEKYLLAHFLWLPYHLIFTTLKTRGLFLIAFYQALKLLPHIYSYRRQQTAEIVTDETIFKTYSS